MNQEQLVLNNLIRALVAERKHGCTNTAVLGGFHLFVQGVVQRLEQLCPAQDWTLLGKLADRYVTLAPAQRRSVLQEIEQILQEKIPVGGLGPVDLNTNQRSDGGTHATRNQAVSNIENSAFAEPYGEGENRSCTCADPKAYTFLSAIENRNHGDLQYLKGVGPERARQLAKLGVTTVEELLLFYPRRYEERRQCLIGDLKDGDFATVTGTVVAAHASTGKTKVIKLSLEQHGRLIIAVWFNQTYIMQQYPVGSTVAVTGKVRWQQSVPEIMVQDIEKVSPEEGHQVGTTSIVGIYPETGKLSSKVLRGIIGRVIDQCAFYFPEMLSVEDRGLRMERSQAVREIHFPSSAAELAKARERLVWEEILFLQLAVARLRQGVREHASPPLTGGADLVRRFIGALPFSLTGAQKRVIGEILADMARTKGMARLVQGDVGSGKTAVAMAALMQAVGSGYQGAMMAPTEILAIQHYNSFKQICDLLGITVVSLLGSQSRAEREEAAAMIGDGRAQVVVGTHALIQEHVVFQSLGLAITDEQHRFGVRQRSSLQSKGLHPHVLVMTATPIPRTLALTLYGDLQLSVLDEMPAGRKPVITRKISERTRPHLEKFLAEQMAQGRQVYVVCPLVAESESVDLTSATERTTYLAGKFPERRVALLHGRMKGAEKAEIMRDFAGGRIDILVATTVVEVGVNVPNATVMVVEGAERFGLAQLHQLRGRVGRGSAQSFCFLVASSAQGRRLDILCQTQDGFKIAEEDLRLRGSGELLGTRQHGLTELRLADLSKDGPLVEQAYRMAQKVLADPVKFARLWEAVDRRFAPDKVGVH